MLKTAFGTIGAKSDNIAYCGLYCEECKRYKNGKCPGCMQNDRASWCGIRKCCIENSIKSCAECTSFSDPKECKTYNNLIARIIGFVSKTDRSLCIRYIQENGYGSFASFMDGLGSMSMKKQK